MGLSLEHVRLSARITSGHPRIGPVPNPRFGFATAGALGGVRKAVSNLENNPILGLAVMDVGGMVLPAAGIEYKERGYVPAREATFREFTGTITNTFLAGGLAAMTVCLYNVMQLNAKKTDFRAWIDTRLLNIYGDITRQIMAQAQTRAKANKPMTVQDVQREFYVRVLKRLTATDDVIPIYKQTISQQFPEFARMLDDGKRLDDETIGKLVDRYLGTNGGHHAYNVEGLVKARLETPAVQRELQGLLGRTEQDFLRRVKKESYTALTQPEKYQLNQLKHQQEEAYRLRLRAIETGWIRTWRHKTSTAERQFVENLFDIAKTRISDEVFVQGVPRSPGWLRRLFGANPQTANTPQHAYSLYDVLRKAKYFGEEALNRALFEHDLVASPEDELTTGRIQTVLDRIFIRANGSWLSRNFVPQAKDGLIPFMVKSKLAISGLPIAVAVFIGAIMVKINNWWTGSQGFPGEEAFITGPTKRRSKE